MSWFRTLGGRRAALRERASLRELCRTDAAPASVLPRPRGRAMVRDPWDDHPRGDHKFHNWKRHRRTQYRPAAAPRPAPPQATVTYVDFAWIPPIRRHHPSTWTPAPSTLPPGPRQTVRKTMLWTDYLATQPDLLAAIAAKRVRSR